MRVSVVIITKNEEENIKRCLKSVYWADEKIVVDSGSSDSTVTQARKMGARVFKLRWKGYASQKNYAINKARGPWILSLDADEEIPRELADEIKRVVSSVKPADGYYINRRNFFYGKELRHGISPDFQLRLFRKGQGKFADSEVHEAVEINGEKKRLESSMLHFSKPDIRAHIESLNSYTDLEAGRAVRIGYRPTGYSVFIRPGFIFLKNYIFKLGLLDGKEGLVFNVINAMYYFIKEIKILEKSGLKLTGLFSTLFRRAR